MMRTVRLELARCREFPEGSSRHGYELQLPLNRVGKLDGDLRAKHRPYCGFRRFWGELEEQGEIRHRHHGWSLSWGGDTADEAIFRPEEHRFAVGEYLSIKERDGVTRTFRVVSVR
ncbi:MAG TPA: hypothetical protein VKT70_15270 [Stellaceae bacterium]|nr:hypothetical protein [Stellaceae bacterium]